MAAGHWKVGDGENRPGIGQPVQVRGVDAFIAHKPQVLIVMIIGNDKDNIGLGGDRFLRRRQDGADRQDKADGESPGLDMHIASLSVSGWH